jgi:5'-nucleotidase
VLPFGNTAATTTITGADVWAALENGVSLIASGAGRFPQVSGLKFTFDMSKASNSGRVIEVTLTDGTPIPNSTDVTYTLATNDFMVAGGDGFTMFGGLAKAKTRDVLETLVREAITKDSLNGPVVMTTDGRITRIGG